MQMQSESASSSGGICTYERGENVMKKHVADISELKHVYEMYMRIKSNKRNQDYVIVNGVKSNEESITATKGPRDNRDSRAEA